MKDMTLPFFQSQGFEKLANDNDLIMKQMLGCVVHEQPQSKATLLARSKACPSTLGCWLLNNLPFPLAQPESTSHKFLPELCSMLLFLKWN